MKKILISEKENTSFKNIFFRTMKLTCLFLFIGFLQLSASGYSQTTKLSLEMRNVKVSKVLDAIEKQSEFRFAYSPGYVDLDRKVTVDLEDKKINEVLVEVFKGTDVVFEILDRHILLHPKNMNPNNKTLTSKVNVAQQGGVSGVVTDDTGQPLPGVTVVVKGTTHGTVTDGDGNYSLTNIPENATLVFSFVGMLSQDIIVGNRNRVDVKMAYDTIGLEEVVTVGYGVQKRTTMTGSVSVGKGEDMKDIPVPNITGSLAGRFSGVFMRPKSGQPGQDDATLYIRGISTTGNNQPLIVIDGIIRSNIRQIDTNIIESISILKDAAAVAPYGLAGANGVILITTQKGEIGAPSLTLDSYYGWQTPTYIPNVLNAKDYMKLQNEAYLNEHPGATNLPWNVDVINNYDALHQEDPDRYGDSNALDLMNIYSPIQKYNMQLSGGTEKVRYFAGLGYLRQNGMFDKENYSRISYNMNMDVDLTSTTLIALSIIGSKENTNDIDPQTSSFRLFRSLYKYYPTDPIYFTNGYWGMSAANSPAAYLNRDSYVRDKGTTILSTISVEQQLPFIIGLSVKGTFSYDMRDNFNKGWHEPAYYWNINRNTDPYTYTKSTSGLESGSSYPYYFLRQTLTKREYFNYQGMINYDRVFGKHAFTGLFVAEARNNQSQNFFAQRNNFTVAIDELNMGSSDKTDYDNGGSSSVGSQIGYVYRLSYVHNSKYMFETTGRYDGHYYFAPGKRWGYFPAFSAGWRLSEEKIMQNMDYVDNLKIRGSWGKSGNLAGSAYQYLSGYTLTGSGYAFGSGTMVQKAYTGIESNPIITWEVAEKSNIGFETTLWNSLLTVEADYFFEKRTGMLMSPAITVPFEYGLSLAQENAGEMKNQGIELRVASRKDFQNGLTLGFDGNISYAKNKMTKVFETSATYNNPNRRRTGRPLNTPFGYKSLGLFTSADDVNGDGKINNADGYNIEQFGTLYPGDIKYADISGPEGIPDGKIDSNDEIALGHPSIPLLTFGFNTSAAWKGFDLDLLFQGSAMNSLNTLGFETVAFSNNKSNSEYEYFNNHWTPDNEDAKYPRATLSPTANNTQFSDFWLISAAHLRLKTAIFGYTIPTSITKRVNIQNLRLYFSGQNLITFSNIKYKDPETTAVGKEAAAYPQMMSFAFGANITF